MKEKTKEQLKDVAIVAASGLGSYLAKKGIDKLFERTTGGEPPKTVKYTDYSVSKVVGYTLVTSFAAGLTSLFLRDRVCKVVEED